MEPEVLLERFHARRRARAPPRRHRSRARARRCASAPRGPACSSTSRSRKRSATSSTLRSVTTTPRCGWCVTSPCSARLRSASRSVLRDTPSDCATCVSRRCVPGTRRPSRIISRSTRSTWEPVVVRSRAGIASCELLEDGGDPFERAAEVLRLEADGEPNVAFAAQHRSRDDEHRSRARGSRPPTCSDGSAAV